MPLTNKYLSFYANRGNVLTVETRLWLCGNRAGYVTH